MLLLLQLLLLVSWIDAKSIASTSDKESGCSFEKGDYSISWYYDDLSSDVVFKLTAKSQHQNFWTGLYLGEENPTDAIGVFVRHGQIGLTDGHVSEEGVVADNLTDVQSLSFDLKDDKLTAEFARPLSPKDKSDADLARCVTFFFPVVAPAIDMTGPIPVATQLEKKRICDIADSCVSRDQSSLVKREEPPTCEYKHGAQLVTWRKEDDDFIFVFEHPGKKGKWWSSVGFGDSMQEMSMVVAFAENGKVKKSEEYTSVGYQVPKKDESNSHSVKLLSSTIKNNRAHYEISVGAGIIEEKMQDGCVTLQMAINSGKYAAKIQKHEILPTAVPVCGIEHCSLPGKNGKKTTKTPKKATTVAILDVNAGAIVDAHEEQGAAASIEEVKNDENGAIIGANVQEPQGTIVDGREGSEFNSDGHNGESVVDAKPENTENPGGSIVDFREGGTNEKNGFIVDFKSLKKLQRSRSDSIVDARTQEPAGAVVDLNEHRPAEFNKDQENGETVVDAHEPNENRPSIVDVNPSNTAAGSIVDFRPEEPLGSIVDANNGPVVVDARHSTQAPAGSIVDFRNDDEFNKDGAAKETVVDANASKETISEGSIVDVRPENEEKPGDSIVDVNFPNVPTGESVIIGFRERPKAVKRPNGSIVDVKVQPENDEFNKDPVASESVVDVHADEDHEKEPVETIIAFRERPKQQKTPTETIIAFREVPKKAIGAPIPAAKREEESGEVEAVVDLHIPANHLNDEKRVNEAIVGIPDAKKQKETIIDLNSPKEVVANGTAEILGEVEEDKDLISKTTKKNQKTTPKPKGTTKIGSIVDVKPGKTEKPKGGKTTTKPSGVNDTIEGSGHEDVVVGAHEVEGSGEAAKPDLSANIDQTENSVVNDLEPLSKNNETADEETGKKLVDTLLGQDKTGATENKKPTTFSPPVSVPQLHSVPSTKPTEANVTPTQPTVAQTLPVVTTAKTEAPTTVLPTVLQPTTSPTDVAWVPKVCVTQDLRVCDSYFADYLSKVAQWSKKHNHTVESSMWKACKLLSQVKHVPSMCCNKFKQTCDGFSHQYT